jgi:hypothetical protein
MLICFLLPKDTTLHPSPEGMEALRQRCIDRLKESYPGVDAIKFTSTTELWPVFWEERTKDAPREKPLSDDYEQWPYFLRRQGVGRWVVPYSGPVCRVGKATADIVTALKEDGQMVYTFRVEGGNVIHMHSATMPVAQSACICGKRKKGRTDACYWCGYVI